MKTPEAEARRALTRLRRALEKARREVRGLRELLDQSEADGYPGDDYAEMDDHLAAVVEAVHREQARQQAKVLRGGGISAGRLKSSGSLGRSGPLRRSSPVPASGPPDVTDSPEKVGRQSRSAESPGDGT